MHSSLSERHSRSMNTLSIHRPRPSMEMRTPAALSTSVKAKLVNWLPWSVLKISGGPCRTSASSKAATQNSASKLLDKPSQHLPAGPVHDRHQVQKAPAHRDVGHVRAPDLVRSLNRKPAEQIRVHPVLGMRQAGPRFLINRHQAHGAHEAANAMATDTPALPAQVAGHLPRAVPGCLQELGIDLAHEREIGLALAGRGSVIARACDAEQPALSADREPRVSGLDPAPPPIEAHRPEALDKKSRSTTSSPILAWSLAIS